jgi:probable rRNA maturation factor
MLRRALTTSAAPSPHVLIRTELPAGRKSRGAYATRRLRDLAKRFLAALGVRGELSILLVGDAGIRRLNRTWRSKDRPTDVLSFAGLEGSGIIGDIVVSLETAERQAAERSAPLSDELARLLAHGILHLRGHDHETPEDACRMAAAELQLLGAFGLVGESLGATPAELEFTRVRRRAQARHPHPARRRLAAPASEARP